MLQGTPSTATSDGGRGAACEADLVHDPSELADWPQVT